MIRSLSPYYVTTSLSSPNTGLVCTSYTLYIKVWSGLLASPPVAVSYKITKDNNSGLGFSVSTDKINISRIINDFIEFAPQSGSSTTVLDGDNQKWVQTYTTYETTDPADSTTAQNISTNLMCLGYSYGNEGVNNDIVSPNILIPAQEYKVYRDGIFIVPILLNESGTNTGSITVKSFPTNEINLNFLLPNTTLSDELVKYIWVNVSEALIDTSIKILYSTSFKVSKVDLYIEDECKYTPIDICFQNKDGALQNVTFFKERIERMSTTSSEFERSELQPSAGFHQFVRFDVQGRTSFSANSGYIDESSNEVFRQLLLSERIYIYENNQFTPINISSKNITYKTRQKERLINYDLNFIYSYNQINNI
tara:strand:+ start:624 stop:1721 length:1098 start_codon:yes stop_codon:yes gene_type:complete